MSTDLAASFHRLLTDILAFKPGSGEAVAGMWISFMNEGVPESDQATTNQQVYEYLATLASIPERLLVAVTKIGLEYYPNVPARLEKSKNVFSPFQLANNWANLQSEITPDVLSVVEMLSGVFRQNRILVFADGRADEADRWIDELRGLLADVVAATSDLIDEPFREFMIRSLTDIIRSLRQFRTGGDEAAANTVYRVLGEAQARQVELTVNVTGEPKTTFFNRLNETVGRLADWMTVVAAFGVLAIGPAEQPAIPRTTNNVIVADHVEVDITIEQDG